jgi:hypothetical protein
MKRAYTLNELSREVHEPYTSLLAFVRTGQLIPDRCTSRFFIFDESRLGEIKAFLLSIRRHPYNEERR